MPLRTKYQRVAPPLKWHGGKHYLAKRIVALMPKHIHYVEPYFGGGSVLLAKDPRGVSEVVNDLHVNLTNFWTVLQNRPLFDEFHRMVSVVPFSEHEWQAAEEVLVGKQPDIDFTLASGIQDRYKAVSLAKAVAFFVRCRQSLAGRFDSFSGITKTRTRRGMNNEVSAWLSAVEGLPAVHERLKRVLILAARPALEVIKGQDGKDTLFYLDPPYLPETRVSEQVYQWEMDRDQHMLLLVNLSGLKGKFILSGYPSKLYDDAATVYGWRRIDFDLPNNAAGGTSKRRMTECVWMNF